MNEIIFCNRCYKKEVYIDGLCFVCNKKEKARKKKLEEDKRNNPCIDIKHDLTRSIKTEWKTKERYCERCTVYFIEDD